MDPFDLGEIFREEADEAVGQMLDLLEGLRQAADDEATTFVRDLFRVAHNVKGAARAAGIEAVERLAHAVEDTLSTIKDRKERPAGVLLDGLLLAVVGIQKLAAGEPEDRGLIERVRALAGPGRAGAAENVASPAEPQVQPEMAPASAPAGEAEPASEGEERAESVRIRTDRLGQLMSLAGELVGTQARLGHRRTQLEALREDVAALRGAVVEAEIPRLRRLIQAFDAYLMATGHEDTQFANLGEALGGALKRVRMLPVRSQQAAWTRIVRETAIALGRELRFEVDVGEVELDKNILDELRDPLVHLLRNAVDHGIETPADRERLGKPREGWIRVRTRTVGQRVVVEVEDDGRGIDLAAVAEKAVARGLIGAAEAATMSADEIRDLVFAAGLSTRAAVSEISGRGFGLDIVRDRVERLGGVVRLTTPEHGVGARFELTVPVSVVSSRGLAVRGSSSVYILPIESVVRSLHVERSELREIDGQLAIEQKDEEPLRLRWLSRWMDEEGEISENILTVVVLQRAAQRIGLVVAEVLGEQTYVTRRLPAVFRQIDGVAGAVILADGRLAPVLDVPGLFAQRAAHAATPATARTVAAKRVPQILVVDDSLTSRTLERNILTAAGYEVTTATDGEEGWATLQAGSFDLVVSDVEMPRLTGLEFVRRIRATPRFERLPVILVTSLGSKHDLSEGAAAGANEYIVKGRFDQTQLIEAVARLL